MKHIKKTVSLLISILLVILITPFNDVYAASERNPVITIKCQQSSPDNSITGTYTYREGVWELSTETSTFEMPAGLALTYDPTYNDNNGQIILTLSNDVTIKTYLDTDKDDSIISCNRDLLIQGTGKLTLIVLSKSGVQPEQHTYSFINVAGDLNIGEYQGAGNNIDLVLDMDKDADATPDTGIYKDLHGLRANSFFLYDTEINANVRNCVLYSSYKKSAASDPSSYISDRLLVENSKIVSTFQNNEKFPDDSDYREVAIFSHEAIDDDFSGNISIINGSEINVKFSPANGEDDIFEQGSAFVLANSPENESTMKIMKSKITFSSKTRINFCNAGAVDIRKCKASEGHKLQCIYDYLGEGAFSTNSFSIENSDFTIKSGIFFTTRCRKMKIIVEPEPTQPVQEDGPVGPLRAATASPMEISVSVSDDEEFAGEIFITGNQKTYVFSELDPSTMQEQPIYDNVKISLTGNKNNVGYIDSTNNKKLILAGGSDPSTPVEYNYLKDNTGDEFDTITECKKFYLGNFQLPGGGGETGGGSSSNHSSHAVPNTSVTE